jgi:DNA-binding NarL/FixJ family response regulator
MLRNAMAEADGDVMATMRCLIVDDHPVVRQGIRAVLEKELRGVEVTDAPTAQAAIDGNAEAPDVAVVDPRGAGGEVEEVVGLLRKRLRCAIVVFTSNGGARLLAEALKAGVKGYVRKDSPPEDLVRAIRAAQEGNFYVDPALSSTIVLEEGDRTLTVRQREILQMLADGMQTEAVARKLGLSTETVRTHTKRILAKLHADTRTQAVAIAIRNGLIE